MKKPKMFSILKHRKKELTKEQLMKDIIAGVIVAIIALPLSIALGISSGVTPEKGLITAIVAGAFIAIFGGSRVQIGGPTGAFVVIVYGIIEKYGIDGLIMATFMAGVILMLFGFLRLGNLIKFIPKSIVLGFTLGIAVTLFSTQIKDLFGLTMDKVPSSFFAKWYAYLSSFGTVEWITLGIGILSILLIVVFPKINKTIPGSLIALVVATCIVGIFNLPVNTIGKEFGTISSTIPMPTIPLFSIERFQQLLVPAFTIAFLAAIESLLSAVVADGMIEKKHNSNTELIGQGLANITSSLFGGIPATGAIARTAANIKSGGRTPIAGLVHAVVLLLIMKIFMPLIQYIPLVALAAILAVVSYNMSEWRECKSIIKGNILDAIELGITFFLTIAVDLVVAIGVSMIFHFIRIKLIDRTEIEDEKLDVAI